jgi:Glycosyl hydrolases family 16
MVERPEERPSLDLSKYKLVWEDGFDGSAGSKPADHWFFFDGWGAGKWRDAYYSEKDAYLDGAGHLVIRSRMEGDRFQTSYLQTYDWKVPKSRWTTFGPGDGKYIETRVMLSDMQAQGPWAAFWLFDPAHAYDGNPDNGTEIDIMEYVVARGLENTYHVANHWGPDNAKWGHEVHHVDAGVYNINLREGWHTFGLQWTAEKLTYYIDGNAVWATTNGVSAGDGQALMLSVEYQSGPGDAWNINKNIREDAASLPNYFRVDYVRVYEGPSPTTPAGTSGGGAGSTMLHRSEGPHSGNAAGEIPDVALAGITAGLVAMLLLAVLIDLLVRQASPRSRLQTL